MIQRANEASVIGTAPSSESLEGLLGRRSMMLFLDSCCTIILARFMAFQLGHLKTPAKTVGIDGCCTNFYRDPSNYQDGCCTIFALIVFPAGVIAAAAPFLDLQCPQIVL